MQNYLNLNTTKESRIKAWDTVYEKLGPHGYQPQYCSKTEKAIVVYTNIIKHLFNYPSCSEVKNYLGDVSLGKYKIKISSGHVGEPVLITLKKRKQ